MRSDARALLSVLQDPARLAGLAPETLTRVLYLARASALIGRLAADADRFDIMTKLPQAVQDQFLGAKRVAALSRTRLTWEMNRIRRAVWGTGRRVVLLKGAAYVSAGLTCAAGRVSSDIDVLMPRGELEWLEATLLAAGWQQSKDDAYDQAYYRNWMHELPPLYHPDRNATIDIHHTILPPTSRYKPDPAKLLARTRSIDDTFSVLSEPDLLLHSACHLFADGEVRGGLRDLVDQRDMMVEFGQHEGFWADLLARAEELGLMRPLAYSLTYAQRLLAVPLPPHVRAWARQNLPGFPVRQIMDACVNTALVPHFIFERRWQARLAAELLYMRSHWLRMPPLMLARHLSIKAWRRISDLWP